MPKVAALLVGINDYPGAPLRGCVNDVLITRDILVKKYNIPTQNIRMLSDNRATKKNILSRLEWLVNCDADIKFFWYSGHGAQFPNQDYENDYEVDGQDELICPVDFDWDGTWIKDDDFAKLFSNVKGKVVCVFDCCHSGTMNRTSLKQQYVKPRAMLAPIDIISRDNNVELTSSMGLGKNINDLFIDTDVAITNNTPKINKKLVSSISDNVVILTGCKDNQTSADAYIGGRYQGALSYAVQSSLIRNLKINYSQLHQEVCRTLRQKRFTQEPNLLGTDINVPFLS